MKGKKMQIRNSTADFLVFTKDSGSDSIEVRVQDHEVWLTQKSLGQLFDVDRSVITKHLKNVFQEGELDETTTCANFAQVADNGRTYHYKFYSLPAIIAVGYRINSTRATQFRQWATKVLDTFTRQGYVLDKDRLINGQIFDEDYFEHLISEIQEIRASERRFYQKITDIYATAVDYSVDSKTTKDFFATVQNKMHYAIHGNTAAEVIMARADHTKEHMGLTTWKNAPDGKIVKAEGKEVMARTTLKLDKEKTAEVVQNLLVSHPKLWDLDFPYRYTVETIIKKGEAAFLLLSYYVMLFYFHPVSFFSFCRFIPLFEVQLCDSSSPLPDVSSPRHFPVLFP